MKNAKGILPGEIQSECWSIFLGADVRNRVCWAMSYLTKENGKYYIEDSYSTYGGHPWGPDSMRTKKETTEEDGAEIIRRIIKADLQNTLPELVRQENLIVFDESHYDFGELAYLRIPKLLLKRLVEMYPDPSDEEKISKEQLREETKTAKCFYISSNSDTGHNGSVSNSYVELFHTNAKQVIKKDTDSFYAAGCSFYSNPQVSYSVISTEEAEKIIADTSQEAVLNLKFEAQRIRILKVSREEIVKPGVGIHNNLMMDSYFLIAEKHVLHRFEKCDFFDGQTCHRRTYFMETVWPLKTNNSDEISSHNYESLRSDTPVFQDSYIVGNE